MVAQAIKNRGTFSVSWKMWNHAANIKISEISVVLRRPCKIESISVIIKPAIFRVILGKRYNDLGKNDTILFLFVHVVISR